MSDSLLRFESGDGSAVLELDPAALGPLASGEPAESPWRLAVGPDWERFESLRLLAAGFKDGSVAAVVAMRPHGSSGHDSDQVSAVFAEGGDAVSDPHEVLLSTETDAEGRVRRVGVEVWTSEEPPPHRLAADRAESSTSEADGVERESVRMDARLDGETGAALFEVLRPR